MTFRIVLQAPPPGVDIGLQMGKGTGYRTVQTQRTNGGDLTFEFTTPAKLGGPFVQGKPGERFVYLDIGTAAGQVGSLWNRRLKIPLTSIPEGAQIVETHVPGKAKDGGPNCATVKPFAGWRAIERPPSPGT